MTTARRCRRWVRDGTIPVKDDIWPVSISDYSANDTLVPIWLEKSSTGHSSKVYLRRQDFVKYHGPTSGTCERIGLMRLPSPRCDLIRACNQESYWYRLSHPGSISWANPFHMFPTTRHMLLLPASILRSPARTRTSFLRLLISDSQSSGFQMPLMAACAYI